MAKRKVKKEEPEENEEKVEKKPKKRKIDKPKGMRIMLSVKDLVRHKKDDKITMPTFGQVKHQDERIGTVNCNFNNMKPASIEIIQELLGTKIEMETPLIMDIYVPKGALLDHYNETVQSTMDEHDDEDDE